MSKIESVLLYLWDNLMDPKNGLKPGETAELLDILSRSHDSEELEKRLGQSEALRDRIATFLPPHGTWSTPSSVYPPDIRRLSRPLDWDTDLCKPTARVDEEISLSIPRVEGAQNVLFQLESQQKAAPDRVTSRGTNWVLKIQREGEYTLTCHIIGGEAKHQYLRQTIRVSKNA